MFLISATITVLLPFTANASSDPSTSFWACFGLLFIFGAVNGMAQGSVYGLAGILPGEYTGAVMFGNGISGVATNGLGMLFLAINPGVDNLYSNSLYFFITSSCVLLVCAYSFTVLQKNEYFKYYKQLSQQSARIQAE